MSDQTTSSDAPSAGGSAPDAGAVAAAIKIVCVSLRGRRGTTFVPQFAQTMIGRHLPEFLSRLARDLDTLEVLVRTEADVERLTAALAGDASAAPNGTDSSDAAIPAPAPDASRNGRRLTVKARSEILARLTDAVSRGGNALDVEYAKLKSEFGAKSASSLSAYLAAARRKQNGTSGSSAAKVVAKKPTPDAAANGKTTRSPKQQRASKLQGRYIGRLRKLTAKDRRRVKATAKTDGIAAAVRLADELLAS